LIIVSLEGVKIPAKKEDELHEEKLKHYRKGYRSGYNEGYKSAINDVKEKMKAHIDEGGANPRWPNWWPFG